MSAENQNNSADQGTVATSNKVVGKLLADGTVQLENGEVIDLREFSKADLGFARTGDSMLVYLPTDASAGQTTLLIENYFDTETNPVNTGQTHEGVPASSVLLSDGYLDNTKLASELSVPLKIIRESEQYEILVSADAKVVLDQNEEVDFSEEASIKLMQGGNNNLLVELGGTKLELMNYQQNQDSAILLNDGQSLSMAEVMALVDEAPFVFEQAPESTLPEADFSQLQTGQPASVDVAFEQSDADAGTTEQFFDSSRGGTGESEYALDENPEDDLTEFDGVDDAIEVADAFLAQTQAANELESEEEREEDDAGVLASELIEEFDEEEFEQLEEETTELAEPEPDNYAPVLDDEALMALTTYAEDEIDNAGTTVIDMINSSGGFAISDQDADADFGIAITGLTAEDGYFEYSLDGGSSWEPLSFADPSNALVLGLNDTIRFVPNGVTAGSGDISFHAWDQTDGAVAGDIVDASVTGDETAFSIESVTATVEVTAINEAPITNETVLPLGAPEVVDYNWVEITGTGTLAASVSNSDDSAELVGLGFTYNFNGTDYTSINISTNGTLTFDNAFSSYNNGILDGHVYDTLAPFWRDLNPSSGSGEIYYETQGEVGSRKFIVQYESVVNYGTSYAQTFQIILEEDSEDIYFQYKDMSTFGATATIGVSYGVGDGQQFSYLSNTLSNEFAIKLSSQPGPAPFTADEEVATVIPNLFVDDVESGDDPVRVTLSVGDGVIDIDSTVVGGIEAGDITDNGTGTVIINATIAQINATFAAANGVLYTSNNGFIGSDTFDLEVNDLGNGGGDPLTANYQLIIEVVSTDVNEAPVLDNTGMMTFTDVEDSDGDNLGQMVSDIINSAGGNRIIDANGDSEGIAIYGHSTTDGHFEYSIDGGLSWNFFNDIAISNALLLGEDDFLRFVPVEGFLGFGDISFYAWDQTDGASGQQVDATVRGGETAFSVGSEVAEVLVYQDAGGSDHTISPDDDNLIGGAGDDNFYINFATEFGALDYIDGGEGSDVVIISDDIDLDLSVSSIQFDNIEVLSVFAPSSSSVTLTESDVMDVTDINNTLYIEGAGNTTVDLTTSIAWDFMFNDGVYNVYDGMGAILYVNQDINTLI